jgi:CTP:molybdopterin cytidylyltransferase MocA
MKRRKSTVALIAAILPAALLAPPVRAQQSQSNFRTLTCQFTSGTSARFDTEWDVKAASDKLNFTFEGIDAARAKAKIVSPFGMSEVLLFKGNNSLNFLEVMPDGNQAFTTVFFSHAREGSKRSSGLAVWYPAAHSRHMMIGRNPVISHYRGYCQPS